MDSSISGDSGAIGISKNNNTIINLYIAYYVLSIYDEKKQRYEFNSMGMKIIFKVEILKFLSTFYFPSP